MEGTEVDFGSTRYVAAVDAATDDDGVGTVEGIAAALDEHAGTAVTLAGEAGRYGDVDAFTGNGQPYRSAGRPPWPGGPKRVGAIHLGAGGQRDEDDDGGAGRPPLAGTRRGTPSR